MQCCICFQIIHLAQAQFAVYWASKPSPRNWSQHVHPQIVIAKAPLSHGQELFLSVEFRMFPTNPFLHIPRSLWMLSPSLNVISHPKLVSSWAMSWRRFQSVCSSGLKTLNSSCPLTDLLSTLFVTKPPGRTWPINHELLSSTAQSVYNLSGYLLPGLYFWNENTMKSSHESPAKIHINYIHFSLLFPKSERSTK